MSNPPLTLERRGHLLLMGFNRPAKRNAFGLDTYQALASAYGQLHRDPELRCGVLFGHGEHFTAGLDLPSWAPQLARGSLGELAEDQIEPFGLDESRRLSKPLVVAAEGISFTVGSELMLAADIRVASTSARFGQLEVKRGFYACGGATIRLVQEIGWGNAQRYLLTGDEFSGADAYRMGRDLDDNWEVLGEAIQTVMRRHGLPEPYEQLKRLTRGQKLGREAIRAFVQELALPEADKQRLLAMTPASYVGNAADQAKDLK